MAAARERLAVVCTGGTLGMTRSPRGYVPGRGLARLLAERCPEALESHAFDVVEYDPPLASATPRHWYDLAETIDDAGRDRSGIVVIHGTDTLAYTASALSFLLPDLAIPVVVTGAQIPLVEPHNDARGNLLAALEIAAGGRPAEVCVRFGPRLLRGNRTTKVQATALDAFASPNAPALGKIGAAIRLHPAPLVRRRPALPRATFGDSASPSCRSCPAWRQRSSMRTSPPACAGSSSNATASAPRRMATRPSSPPSNAPSKPEFWCSPSPNAAAAASTSPPMPLAGRWLTGASSAASISPAKPP